ncbi:MAG: bifunctional hydroxymethylpyrimidine kinase/phosphomethylpyrimidine kinase [Bacillota bacterium]
MYSIPRVLTIAGSDSGGGAGIQADLKAFTVLGVYGMSAVTAVTAQNTLGVYAVHNLPPDVVGAQIDVVVSDIGVDALKTGMLSTPDLVSIVGQKVVQHRLENLVVDPVMVAKGGTVLLDEDARVTLRDVLLPLALVVTPNVPEAEALAEMEVRDVVEMKEAARRVVRLGARTVVIKGGHLPPFGALVNQTVDIFYDGTRFTEFWGPRFQTKNTHGTGCTFSAVIAAELARGASVEGAVRKAKEFITAGIEHSLELGSGHGPTNPWAGARWTQPARHSPGVNQDQWHKTGRKGNKKAAQ